MSTNNAGKSSWKNCPCCGSYLDDGPLRRRNFNRWRIACVVLFFIAAVVLVAGLLLVPQRAVHLFSVGVVIAVTTLFSLSGSWRRDEAAGNKPPDSGN